MSTIRRLVGQLIADDPQPEPSWLDRWDRRCPDGCGPQKPLCSHLDCTETPTTEIHGWKLCQTHSPAMV